MYRNPPLLQSPQPLACVAHWGFISCEDFMNSFFPSWPRLTKGAASLVFALGTTVAFAQGSPSAPTPKLIYRSVWAQYQGFTEQSVTPWRQSNDTVERAGGWRAYAKEARQPDAPDKSDAKPVTSSVKSQQGDKP